LPEESERSASESAAAARPADGARLERLSQALAQGREHHQAGRLEVAGRIYAEILEQQPRHADALHLLGVIALQRGRPAEAIALIEQALAIQPHFAWAHNNLGVALNTVGQNVRAERAFAAAIAADDTFADAHLNLGETLHALGKQAAAVAAFERCIELQPDLAPAHFKLSELWREAGCMERAVPAYRQAKALDPSLAAEDRTAETVHRFHLIDGKWPLPPFDPATDHLLPIVPLIEAARDRTPRTLAFAEVCFQERVASTARYERCNTAFPGIVLAAAPNPCNRPYRLVDGNHRVHKLRTQGAQEGRFFVFTLEEVRHLIRPYRDYLGA